MKYKVSMGVSLNGGFSPQIIHFNEISIRNHPFWGFYPYFWKLPYSLIYIYIVYICIYVHDDIPGPPLFSLEGFQGVDS